MELLIRNHKFMVSIFLTLLIVFSTSLTGYADITPVSNRTSEVRDAIVAAVPGINNAADVTDAHLNAITRLNLRGKGISVLKTGDFSGLAALINLNLYNNRLSSLPDGIFEGMTSLTTVRLGRNAIDPFPLTVSLENVGSGEFKAVAPAGALFDIVLPITVTNGSITGGATSLTIPHGSVESSTLTVTRTGGTTAHVTVDIGKLPSLPRNHYGYALVKAANLPLVIIRGPNTAPEFSDGTTTIRSVAENSARGVNIGDPVSATDADGDTLTYSLSGIDASNFSIISSSGQLQTRSTLDYETKAFYSVTVAASDSYGGSDNINVRINVTDVQENRAPVFTEGNTTNRSVAENTGADLNIGTAVAATDADNDTLTYTLGGTDAAAFNIDRTTGQIKTKASLDYETKNTYSVTLTVSDGLATDAIAVTINVTDIDENRAPVFSEGDTTNRSVAENTGADLNIGTAVAATDADNDTLTYTLGGTDAAAFNIDRTTGQIKTKASLDYETKNTYSVTLTVSDGLATDTIVVTINVTDIDENRAPIFTEGSNATRKVAENATAGMNIGNAIAATDPDNDTLTYSLGGQDASAFGIDTTTGQLRTNASLDYETKSIYSVSVTVSDSKLTATIAVTINVLDVDELPDQVTEVKDVSVNNPPVFTDGSSTSRSVAENTGSGVDIGTPISATDTDGHTLTYSLGGTDAAAFTINSTTGQLRTNASLDYEVKSIYVVSVTTSDGTLTDSITVTINITDVNETPTNNAPEPEPEPNLSIVVINNPGPGYREGSNPYFLVEVQVDEIPTQGHTVTFSIEPDDGNVSFAYGGPTRVTGSNGRSGVTLRVGDRASGTYTVTASSGTASVSRTVTVGTVPSLSVSISSSASNASPGDTVKFTATVTENNNPASGQALTFRIIRYTGTSTDIEFIPVAGTASLSSTSATTDSNGQASTSLTIGSGASGSYAVSATLSDGRLDVASVTVEASSPPVFSAPEFTEGTSTTRLVAESTASGTNIGTAVSATDADDDTLTYSLGGTDASSFSIDTTTGQLQTNAALDYDTKNSYSVTVSVSDGNGGSDSITVTINVTDLVGTSIISTNITTCSVTHKSGDVYDATIEGTLTASQSVRSLTVHGYVNGPIPIGTDRIGFLDAGETANFSVTGTWTHDGSTSQDCDVILTYVMIPVRIPIEGNNAPVGQLVRSETVLLPNYPNPFNPETWIPYQLAKPAEVTLTIYNTRGVVVQTIVLGHQAAGVYTSRSRAIHWDGRNMFGEKVATGLYFYTLKTGDFTATRKMLIRK